MPKQARGRGRYRYRYRYRTDAGRDSDMKNRVPQPNYCGAERVGCRPEQESIPILIPISIGRIGRIGRIATIAWRRWMKEWAFSDGLRLKKAMHVSALLQAGGTGGVHSGGPVWFCICLIGVRFCGKYAGRLCCCGMPQFELRCFSEGAGRVGWLATMAIA